MAGADSLCSPSNCSLWGHLQFCSSKCHSSLGEGCAGYRDCLGRYTWVPVCSCRAGLCWGLLGMGRAGKGISCMFWAPALGSTRGFAAALRQLLVTSLPPCLPPPPLTGIACRAFLGSIPCFNTCESGSQKRSGWLRGSDVKTMEYGAAGVSEKLKGFLQNFSLSVALLKKRILMTVKCVRSHSVISLVHFSVWFW